MEKPFPEQWLWGEKEEQTEDKLAAHMQGLLVTLDNEMSIFLKEGKKT